MKKYRGNILIVLIAGAIVFATHLVKKTMDARVVREEKARLQVQYDAWKLLPYSSLTDRSLLTNVVSNVSITGADLLTNVAWNQERLLRKKIVQFYNVYDHIDANDYYAFRWCAPCKLFFKSNYLNQCVAPGTPVPIDPKEQVLVYHRYWYSQVPETNRITLKEFNTNTMTITVQALRAEGNQAVAVLRSAFKGVVFKAHDDVVRYEETPASIIRQQRRVLAARVENIVVMGRGEKTFPTPVVATFYWSDKAQDWIPWEMAYAGYVRGVLMF